MNMKKIITADGWDVAILITLLILRPALNEYARMTGPHARVLQQIRNFKEQDEKLPPPKNAVLFIGTSSIKDWNTLQEDFPSHRVISRGIGGSKIRHFVSHAETLIFRYEPRQIVLYVGENDLAADAVTPVMVLERFKELFHTIRERRPDLPIVGVSLKPSPRRRYLLPQTRETNRLIKDFLAMQEDTVFVDVFTLMLDNDGQPKPALFLGDGLHMNAQGYAIWRNAILPSLGTS
jgi:hypothetical protein